jgi:YD repeat-containing protein
VAEYAYNGADQLTSVKDPRLLSTTYTLDGLDNLTTQVSPDTGSYTNNASQIALGFDLADNIAQLTDPAASSNTKSFTYDKLNRLTGYGMISGMIRGQARFILVSLALATV